MLPKTDEIEAEVKKTLSTILELSADSINMDSNIIDELGADSMMMLEIIVSLDKKFNIEIPEDQFQKIKTPRHAAELVLGLLSNENKQ